MVRLGLELGLAISFNPTLNRTVSQTKTPFPGSSNLGLSCLQTKQASKQLYIVDCLRHPATKLTADAQSTKLSFSCQNKFLG